MLYEGIHAWTFSSKDWKHHILDTSRGMEEDGESIVNKYPALIFLTMNPSTLMPIVKLQSKVYMNRISCFEVVSQSIAIPSELSATIVLLSDIFVVELLALILKIHSRSFVNFICIYQRGWGLFSFWKRCDVVLARYLELCTLSNIKLPEQIMNCIVKHPTPRKLSLCSS